MRPRLLFSLNADGTVTLRCEAAAFFAHADEIRRLLGDRSASAREERPAPAAPPRGDAGPEGRGAEASLGSQGSEGEEAEAVRAMWSRLFPPDGAPRRDLSRRAEEVLAAGWHLTCRRGFPAFGAADVERLLLAAGVQPSPRGEGPTLVQLARDGWLDRVRRGRYALTMRGQDRIAGLLQEAPRRARRRPRRAETAAPVLALPDLSGLSRFLKDVRTTLKWKRVLLVAYFLTVHCGVEEFDQRLVAACFRRLRGQEPPGSLPALISQVLTKRRGWLERGSGRGRYRISAAGVEELKRDPRVAEADLKPMARTG